MTVSGAICRGRDRRHDAQGRRPVCVPARSLQPDVRLPVRLGHVPGRSNRHDRGRVAWRSPSSSGCSCRRLGRQLSRRSRFELGGFAVSLSTQQLVAVALIVFLTLVNTRGLKLGKWIQNTFTFTKTAALFGLIVVGLVLGGERPERGLDVVVVEPGRPTAGMREAPSPTCRSRAATALLALAGTGHDRAVVLPVGVEQRDVHRRRNSRARAARCPAP